MKKILSAVFCAALLFTGMNAFAAKTATANGVPQVLEVYKNAVPTEGLKKITIDAPAEDIIFEKAAPGGQPAIFISVRTNYADSMISIMADPAKGFIKIEQKTKIPKNQVSTRQCQVILNIPADFVIPELTLNAGSKDITIADQPCTALAVSTGTGRIILKNLTVDTLSVDAGSGRLAMSGIVAQKSITLTETASEASMSQIEADEINVKVGKGKFVMSNCLASKISCFADKGTANIYLGKLADKGTVLTSASGNIVLGLPEKSVFWTSGEVDAKGHFVSDFPQDSKGPKIVAKVTAGGEIKIGKIKAQ